MPTNSQWGLVTSQQARAAGVAWRSLSRLAEGGLLERAAHGVYRVRGAAEPDHLALREDWLGLDPARPACERLGDVESAVVSHASAAALYGVGDLRDDVHEFSLPRRRQTRRPDVRIHRSRVPPEQRVVLGGLPTTRAGRMISDLLADRVDPDTVARIVAEVLERALEYPREVAEVLAPHGHRFGCGRGDGPALLDELLQRAGSREREVPIAAARPT